MSASWSSWRRPTRSSRARASRTPRRCMRAVPVPIRACRAATPAQGRGAEPGRAAVRLLLPSPLPPRRRTLHARGAATAGAVTRPFRALPFRGRDDVLTPISRQTVRDHDGVTGNGASAFPAGLGMRCCTRPPRHDGYGNQQGGVDGKRSEIGAVECLVGGAGQQGSHVGWQGLRHHQRLVDAFAHRRWKDRSLRQNEDRRVELLPECCPAG